MIFGRGSYQERLNGLNERDWSGFTDYDHRITTRIDVSSFSEIRANALKAHATQVDPSAPMWFGLPPDVDREMVSSDEYVLAISDVKTDLPENDLFAGLR